MYFPNNIVGFASLGLQWAPWTFVFNNQIRWVLGIGFGVLQNELCRNICPGSQTSKLCS